MANFDPHLIDEMAEVITESLDDGRMPEVIEEALAEQYDEADVESMGSEGFDARRHELWARALLRAAEQQFILAMGMVEDTTPSSVSPGN